MALHLKYMRNPHQKEFHEDVTSMYLHMSGGYGSGKSFALIPKFIQLMDLNKDLPGGLVCPSYTDFMTDMNPAIEEFMDKKQIKFKYHKTEHWYKFPWSKAKLYVKSAEKQIKGPNWAFAVINEVTLIDFARYQEIIARVRLKMATHPQIASNGTPEGLFSGYYDFFIENPRKGARVIYGDTRDNLQNLSSSYVESLHQAYDERMLEAYMSGKFISMVGNAFYYSYSDKNVDSTMVEKEDYPVFITMDFNVDPMVATIWQYQADGSLGAVNEIILKQNADTNKMCTAMVSRGYVPDRVSIFPDPAGNARSTKGRPDNVILKEHGYYDIRVKGAAPNFRKRQLNVNNLLEKVRLKVNKLKCPWMHRDLLLCAQNTITLEKMKDNPELTHSSDGLDYMCDILFPFSGAKPSGSVVKIR